MSKPAWLDTVPDWAISGLCVFDVFRGLGFESKDIFFSANGPAEGISPEIDGKYQVNIVLLTQGKEFAVMVAFVKESYEDICDKWTKFATRAAAGEFLDEWKPVAERNSFWRQKGAIIAKILNK